MVLAILAILGKFFAAAPECVAASIARVFGALIYYGMRSRRRLLLSNLHHAFPEKQPAWHRRIARESCRRMVEMSLFALASPYFAKARIRKMFKPDAGAVDIFERFSKGETPFVALTPHFSLMEAETLSPAFCDNFQKPNIGVFYRPFKSKALERRIKQTRERFGVKLLSKKDGFAEAINILRENGASVVLFDQNTGKYGALTLFMGRVVSTSQLAGLLAEKVGAKPVGFYIERTGFWRGTLRGEEICTTPNADIITIAGNVWLEQKLRGSDNLCADWLWMHNRWKIQHRPDRRFRLEQKRDLLPETLAAHRLSECPRNTRFWLRVPGELAPALLSVPVIRALRKGRPDAQITLVGPRQIVALLARFGIAEKTISPPAGTLARCGFFRRLRNEFPDTFINLTDDFAADFDARLTGAPQRFGMSARRSLLTHAWKKPAGLDETRLHLTRLWERRWRDFGLRETPDLAPIAAEKLAGEKIYPSPAIAFVCGAGADRETQWSAENRLTLALQTAGEFSGEIRLLSLRAGCSVAAMLAKKAPPGFFADFPKNTPARFDLCEVASMLAGCAGAVCDSLDALMLANALGVPAVGVFSEEKIERCGPIFESPTAILNPGTHPERVLFALKSIAITG